MVKRVLILFVIALLCIVGIALWRSYRQSGVVTMDYGASIPTDLTPMSGQVVAISDTGITVRVQDPSATVTVSERSFSLVQMSNIILVLRQAPPVVAASPRTEPASDSILGSTRDVPVGTLVTVMFSQSDTAATPVAWRVYAPEP